MLLLGYSQPAQVHQASRRLMGFDTAALLSKLNGLKGLRIRATVADQVVCTMAPGRREWQKRGVPARQGR
jgi:hypothetical protein